MRRLWGGPSRDRIELLALAVALGVGLVACRGVVVPDPSPTPIASTTPGTSTPSPTPTGQLYHADWSHGLAGWTGDPSWAAVNGTLVNNGAVSDTAGFYIAAPYRPPTPDYAVEADMQFVGGGYVWVFARCTTSCNSAARVTTYNGVISKNSQKARIIVSVNGTATTFYDKTYVPDTQRHKYRLECKGNQITFFLDGKPVVGPQGDSTISESGQVGLGANDAHVTVYSFTVYKL